MTHNWLEQVFCGFDIVTPQISVSVCEETSSAEPCRRSQCRFKARATKTSMKVVLVLIVGAEKNPRILTITFKFCNLLCAFRFISVLIFFLILDYFTVSVHSSFALKIPLQSSLDHL